MSGHTAELAVLHKITVGIADALCGERLVVQKLNIQFASDDIFTLYAFTDAEIGIMRKDRGGIGSFEIVIQHSTHMIACEHDIINAGRCALYCISSVLNGDDGCIDLLCQRIGVGQAVFKGTVLLNILRLLALDDEFPLYIGGGVGNIHAV